jgi:hypothetical protein
MISDSFDHIATEITHDHGPWYLRAADGQGDGGM